MTEDDENMDKSRNTAEIIPFPDKYQYYSPVYQTLMKIEGGLSDEVPVFYNDGRGLAMIVSRKHGEMMVKRGSARVICKSPLKLEFKNCKRRYKPLRPI